MQSVLAGMGMSLAAMGAAAAGLLPAVWGALLQEGIDVAVYQIARLGRLITGVGDRVPDEADIDLRATL